MKTTKNLFWSFLVVLISLQPAFSQYFGRNKPRYQAFDFKVYETSNFDIYHYFRDKENLDRFAEWMEVWYKIHQSTFDDTFHVKNPVILYENHADFQQTNAISSTVSVGTGGVTEAFKNRVVMPVTAINQQTNHVLGHELVHAFQYHMILGGDSTSLKSLQNLPLWLVEGLAEYMSVGKYDSHTSMWMRDAIINDKLPTIKDLYNPKFFPYRYGQAFWAFLGGYYGDNIIKPFFMSVGQYGMSYAIDSLLGINTETLGSHFQNALKTYYEPYLGDKKENFLGKRLIDEKNAGEMNVSPSLSPNGRYVIFLSEKDLFSTDLYLADARTGELMRKVASTVKDGHLDNLSFIESSGTWSPNSREFAFVAFKQGRQLIVVKDVLTSKTVNEISPDNISGLSNPAWSPDGRSIVFTGLVDGQSDLFLYDLRSKSTSRLTNDFYSDIQANWSPDGKSIVFSTDRISMDNGRINGNWYFNLAIMDVESRNVTYLDFLRGTDQLNPQYDHQSNILFLSDRDGFRNLYKYRVDDGSILKLTDFKVGISGITKYSPAMTVSIKRDRTLFSHYFDGKYVIYQADSADFLSIPIDPHDVDFGPATLPVVGLDVNQTVTHNLNGIDQIQFGPGTSFRSKDYKPLFKLDYIGGSAGGGVGVSNAFGTQTGLAGGVDLLFSDILGNNQLYTGLALNGEIYDIAGIFQFVNKKGRFAYGAGISHIPNRTGFFSGFGLDTLEIDGQLFLVNKLESNLVRIFQDGLSVFGHYPISTTQRFEVDASATYQYFRIDRYNNYFDNLGRLIGQDREKIPLEKDQDLVIAGILFKKGFLFNTNVAFVGDNSYFGMASPMQGYRYRASIGRTFGKYDLVSALGDYRKYHFIRPVSLAFRTTHFGYYGKDSKSFFPIYLGQMGLVRGFPISKEAELIDRYGIGFNEISGSKILVSSFEVRMPFTGPERLAAIQSQFFFSELAFFVDGGVAFDDFSEFNGKTSEGFPIDEPEIIFSTGLSLRVNLFGALIIEPYYAFPIRQNSKGIFGLNLVPGW